MGNSCPEAVSIVFLKALYQPQQFIPEFKSGCLGILYGTNANQMLIFPKGALAFKGNDGYLVTLASLDNMKGDQCVIMICNHFFD